MPERVHRNTRQRQGVLEELRKLTSHPTAAQLYEITRTNLPKISLGTVYRNLEVLARTGVIRKLQIGGGEARFDANPGRHYHVQCARCERVDDIHDMPADFVKEEIKSLSGYEILGFRMVFVGVCPECKKRQKPIDDGISPEDGV